MFSIYIPRISVNESEYSVQETLKHAGIGLVVRVDFTSINKKKGFHESIEQQQLYKSAFVHLMPNEANEYVVNLINSSDESTHIKIFPYPGLKNYWLLFKNKKPVGFTMMNIHQVVDNAKYLEDKVNAQEEKISSQEKEIEALKSEIAQIYSMLSSHNIN